MCLLRYRSGCKECLCSSANERHLATRSLRKATKGVLKIGPARATAHVRFGSKADICSAPTHVRFTPESGHVRRTSSCLLWAKSGHWLLLITSSARVRDDRPARGGGAEA